jgi:hypothetical protein
MPREIPRYRALEKIESLTLNDRRPHIVYAGEEVFFDGKPGPALLPLNGSARAAKLKAIAAGPHPKAPVDTPRLARSLGFLGFDPDEAQAFIQNWVVRETSRYPAAPGRSSSSQRGARRLIEKELRHDARLATATR